MHFIKREDDISLHLFWLFRLLDKEKVDFETHSSSKVLLSEEDLKGHGKGNFLILQSPLTIGFRRF